MRYGMLFLVGALACVSALLSAQSVVEDSRLLGLVGGDSHQRELRQQLFERILVASKELGMAGGRQPTKEHALLRDVSNYVRTDLGAWLAVGSGGASRRDCVHAEKRYLQLWACLHGVGLDDLLESYDDTVCSRHQHIELLASTGALTSSAVKAVEGLISKAQNGRGTSEGSAYLLYACWNLSRALRIHPWTSMSGRERIIVGSDGTDDVVRERVAMQAGIARALLKAEHPESAYAKMVWRMAPGPDPALRP